LWISAYNGAKHKRLKAVTSEIWKKEFRVTQPFLRITKEMRLIQQKEYEGSKGSKRKVRK
jgi:hypothetical protein